MLHQYLNEFAADNYVSTCCFSLSLAKSRRIFAFLDLTWVSLSNFYHLARAFCEDLAAK